MTNFEEQQVLPRAWEAYEDNWKTLASAVQASSSLVGISMALAFAAMPVTIEGADLMTTIEFLEDQARLVALWQERPFTL